MGALLKSIVQVGTFLVCAQVIEHFRPDASYEKYLKVLVGTMILAQAVAPMFRFFSGGSLEFGERVEYFEEQMAAGMEQADEIAERADWIFNQMSLDEVRKRLAQEQDGRAGDGADGSGEETAGSAGDGADGSGEEAGSLGDDAAGSGEEASGVGDGAAGSGDGSGSIREGAGSAGDMDDEAGSAGSGAASGQISVEKIRVSLEEGEDGGEK